MEKLKFQNIDQYIALFPKNIQEILEKLRQIIKTTAPAAEESINYQMPAFKLLGKPLVYFGAYKNHIGFYPTPSGTKAFEKDIKNYVHAKGSIQFPLNQPIPYSLVQKIVEFRTKEILNKNS